MHLRTVQVTGPFKRGNTWRMRVRRRASKRSATARWREACMDGVLHVAYAAAERAESAAERCVGGAWRPPGARKRRGRRGLRGR